ncbi:DUF4372 domain-containing protein [Blastochloris sulfoviridis]|uniref:DUF4372 domain-containing protein n=1 Tax=Blastochloris sulfoviridis TaxID=50712 RepID=A0A5M6I164_9HYPH|nr:DUF4372 domain-containing protein [Blastochloris sulfoviridis]
MFPVGCESIGPERINAVQHQNSVFHGLLKHVPWAVFDRLVDGHNADWDDRGLKTKAHLIAMLYAQLFGVRSLRDLETNLKTHAGKLYHLGDCTVSWSALSTANATRPVGVFGGLLSALMAQLQAGYVAVGEFPKNKGTRLLCVGR